MKLYALLLAAILATGSLLDAAASPITLSQEEKAAAYKATVIATTPPYVWDTAGSQTVLRVLGVNLLQMPEQVRAQWIKTINEAIKTRPRTLVHIDTHNCDTGSHIEWPDDEPAWVEQILNAVIAKSPIAR